MTTSNRPGVKLGEGNTPFSNSPPLRVGCDDRPAWHNVKGMRRTMDIPESAKGPVRARETRATKRASAAGDPTG